MKIRLVLLTLLVGIYVGGSGRSRADNDLPLLPKGFAVDVIAREPMVSNPCVMAFDRFGRICVGQGPQYRKPKPDTPGDRVDILIDENGDGVADRRKTFAEGFNSIQGLAWHGRDLWVANAPDLTVVRDLDGDDKADEYVRVYTDLGNLEHGLHGLNFGPDGRLYMSKGNSKGYNQGDELAPRAFRDLWGLASPNGAPDYLPIETTDRSGYQRKYHKPSDDWGQQGGVLRCDPYRDGQVSGRALEIVARGFRNPWDIAFDDAFNWLGTDNDQSTGDRIFMPFYGAHFGWGHPWTYSWTGKDHLPTVPISGPTFEGSGTGVSYYYAKQFPPQYRDLFFVGDWLRREVLAFRPQWDGALMVSDSEVLEVFAHAGGGRTMPKSDGRAFDPTDMEVGPDGCLYILSWGHEYGVKLEDGKQANVGRVYRIRYEGNSLESWSPKRRARPINDWSLDQLFIDLGSPVAAWRVNAQNELLRRKASAEFLLRKLGNPPSMTRAQQTWAIWTLARAGKLPARLFEHAGLNRKIQTIRALAFQEKTRSSEEVAGLFAELLASSEPRLRFEAIQAIGQARIRVLAEKLLDHLNHESERIAFYTTWNTLRELLTLEERRMLLDREQGSARLGLLLGLLADDVLAPDEVELFRRDRDRRVATIAEQWLIETGGAKPFLSLSPEPGRYNEPVVVEVKTTLPDHHIAFTLDGSVPTKTSESYSKPLTIDRSMTLTVALLEGNNLVGRVVKADYQIQPAPEYFGRCFISDISTRSGNRYEMDYRGVEIGKRVYTDRDYKFTKVPDELLDAPFLRGANADDRSRGNRWISFTTDARLDVLLGVDTRGDEPLRWMRINEPEGFVDTGMNVQTDDANFRLYRKAYSAGEIVLGGNTNERSDSARGNYLLIFQRKLLLPGSEAATQAQVLAAMETADLQRGRELFMHPRGAGCVKCHAMRGVGRKFAPDLSDLGNRAKTPDAIIMSILKPSAVITEGFAQQRILTEDGRLFSGAVIQETQRSLKLVGADGELVAIDKANIEERVGTEISPMPAGYGEMMSAQQIADIVAWLMTQKATDDSVGTFRHEQANPIHFQQQTPDDLET
ncbi:MAG: c-type cytochrome [Planctomycetaceae bacterium]|nr:c-type cytochrome [Planctomycetaceae bacterium]